MRSITWESLLAEAKVKGLKLSSAESCTGGYIASRITDIPGASDCYLGGFVAYSDELKRSVLGVDADILLDHGAVSRETALEMAKGCHERTGSDISIAVTGIAGPSGGTEEKPVGTVYISLFLTDGRDVTEGFLLDGLTRSEFKEAVEGRVLGMVHGAVGTL
jgi:PncC family amidohydrolase